MCCAGFTLELISKASTSTTLFSSASASASPIENNSIGGSSSGNDARTTKISYRSAKSTDLSAIAGLLNSVFDDDEKGEEQGDGDDDDDATPNSNDTNENTFMWDSLGNNNNEPQLSPEKQRQFIETKLAQRMADAKKEGSFPHSFLVATIPSSVVDETTNEQEEQRLVGFLEMGTLPSPIPISIDGNVARPELPYIGNVAVSNDVRRRKVGSTLVRLATKIAAKWCAPSSETASFPPFIFLSVERDNNDALLFYERLGFEELSVAAAPNSKSNEKIYLARGLD